MVIVNKGGVDADLVVVFITLSLFVGGLVGYYVLPQRDLVVVKYNRTFEEKLTLNIFRYHEDLNIAEADSFETYYDPLYKPHDINEFDRYIIFYKQEGTRIYWRYAKLD